LRMRKKPNLIPRMDRCQAVWVQNPEKWKGIWRRQFKRQDAPLCVELGCGKGRFTVDLAGETPNVLYIAIERVPEAMVMAMERAMEQALSNVYFISEDVSQIFNFFETHEVDRIYINFCDPWPGNKHSKRRLTSERFIQLYDPLLRLGGEIHFKTDNQPLFLFSLEQFEQCGYSLSEITYDLHANGPVGCMTDYEKKFYAKEVPICRCVATKTKEMERPNNEEQTEK
jgi:tRNA (guanine-N7-)-methyltransferase